MKKHIPNLVAVVGALSLLLVLFIHNSETSFGQSSCIGQPYGYPGCPLKEEFEEEEIDLEEKSVEFKWDTYHEDAMADLEDDLDDEDWDEDDYDVEVEWVQE